MGHQVELVTAADTIRRRWEIEVEEGVNVLQPPRWGGVGTHDGGYSPVDILTRVPMALKKWDLIHAFEHRPNVSVPALISRIRRTPLVTDWSDWWTKGGITTPRRKSQRIDEWEGTWIEEGTKKISDRVTVVSRTLWDRAVSIGIPEERLSLIPSGCPHERIRPLGQSACRRELSLPLDAKVLTFAGFAFWDFAFLVKAFRKVLEQFPDAILQVVGQDKDSEIEDIAQKELGDSAGQVRFAGRFSPDRLEVPLGASDIQLLPLEDTPANWARWPIKFGDYLASGRPTVAPRVGDSAPILEKEEAGIATEANPEAFAEGILLLLNHPEQAAAMGERARKLAEGPLSWEVQVKKMENLYLDCLSARKKS
ncbi:MAG: glycosyltransferase family 4 protein [Candidatus Omnitrophica bacterium]|nr:glycosyltransferase family 4 protein [Candidatus Omnitrophota bacterium]